MKTLAIEPLTREAFAPFGDVIELEGAKQIPINLGTTIRYHDLANVDVPGAPGRAWGRLRMQAHGEVPEEWAPTTVSLAGNGCRVQL